MIKSVAGAIDARATPRATIFTAEWITRILVYAMLLAFPFQILAVPVGTTVVDISNIIFIGLLAWLLTFAPGAKTTIAFRIAFSAFLLIEITNYLYIGFPINRFISAMLWIGGVLLLYGYRSSVRYNVRVAYYCILFGVFCAAVVCAYDRLVLGIDRPPGLMSEPSPEGMVLLAALSGSLIALRSMKNSALFIGHLGFGALLLILAFQLKTMHFFSFVVALAIMGVIMRLVDWRVGILSVPLVMVVYTIVSSDAHYIGRFDFSAARITNISLLAWLDGFAQMKISLWRYPVFGAGLGGTGYFYYYSVYSQQLQLYNLANLNRLDAFSGFFRLVIELGPVIVFVMLAAFYAHLRRFARAARAGVVMRSPDATALLYLMTFSVTIIIGTLIKEPTWSHSTVVVSALLFFTLPYAADPGPAARSAAGRSDGRQAGAAARQGHL